MPIGDGRLQANDRRGAGGSSGDQFQRFLRCGHVLRSLLREFLEEDFLHRACRVKLTRSQFCFLKLIATNSDLQVGELARALGVSPAASSKNLDTLEQLGLVNRMPSLDDRRVILLSASGKGRELVEEYEELKARQIAPVIERLGEERTNELCDMLEEVCVGVLARAPHPRETCLRCAGYYRSDCAFEQLQGECALRPRRGEEADA